MPILSLTVATAIALGAGTATAPAAPLTGTAAELQALDHKFAEAFQKEDIEGVMACYADDAVLMDPNNLMAFGKVEIRLNYIATFAVLDDIKLAVMGGSYGSEGNVGYGFGKFSMTAKTKTGESVAMRGRQSSVAVKKGDKWVYLVDHASIPQTPMPDPTGAVVKK